MNYKKTFWMNILFAIALVFLYFVSYATDIDYVEHTTRQKIIRFSVQLSVLAVPIITAIHLYKFNCLLLRKLALIGNCFSVVLTVLYIVVIFYNQPSINMDEAFFIIVFAWAIFILPLIINLKTLRH
jgi:putative effector of murein hydrolase